MEKKTILIAEDNAEVKKFYLDLIKGFFPGYSVTIIDEFYAAKEFALTHLAEIAFAILDGKLLKDELAYPIAVAMRGAGYDGFIFLVAADPANVAIPDKNARHLYNGFVCKPLQIGQFAELLSELLA